MTDITSRIARWGIIDSSCVCQELEDHPDYSDQIAELLDQLDFMKIEAVMQQLSWKTSPTGKVPTIDSLKSSAKSLLEETAERGPASWVSTGGFHIENNYGYLRIAFEIESWQTNV